MRFLTSGDSHGRNITAIVEGYPAGVPVTTNFLKKELLRRSKCLGRSSRMEIENEEVVILSGVRKGVSTGNPITILIPNNEFKDLEEGEISKIQSDVFTARPGHADLNGVLKYGFDEARNVIERTSARETVARVAVGALAKLFLKEFDVSFASAIIQVGKINSSKNICYSEAKRLDKFFPFADPKKQNEVFKMIRDFKETGETLGGKVWVCAKGVIPGIGSYANWDKRLDAQIAYNLMSIPSIKGVLIGEIEKTILLEGSNAQDSFKSDKKCFYKRKTNFAGGIEGGISNGEDIIVTLLVKPIPSSKLLNYGINIKTKKIAKPEIPRSDTTSLAPVAVISESLMAIVLMQNYLEKFGADSLIDIKQNFNFYKKRLKK